MSAECPIRMMQLAGKDSMVAEWLTGSGQTECITDRCMAWPLCSSLPALAEIIRLTEAKMNMKEYRAGNVDNSAEKCEKPCEKLGPGGPEKSNHERV